MDFSLALICGYVSYSFFHDNTGNLILQACGAIKIRFASQLGSISATVKNKYPNPIIEDLLDEGSFFL